MSNETMCWNCNKAYGMAAAKCPSCGVTNANHDYAQASDEFDQKQAATASPAPQIPPPVWDKRPIDASGAMAAVRAMCGAAHG